MAVKASIQITISKVIDVYAVYRYYKLQSSTLAKPSKPTVNHPSGWSDTEPAYVSGSTNTLYFVDCNVYSDKTFTFSEVSKSSTYEAAKDAWNKANNAQNTANSAKDTIDNMEIGGRNMLRGSSFEGLSKVDNTYMKYKNNSVKLTVDNISGTSIKYAGISTLQQSWELSDVLGKTLVISMWIYIEKVDQLNGYEFRIVYSVNGTKHWFDIDKRYPYYIPNAGKLEVGWNYIYGCFTIPTNATEAYFSFTCYANAGKTSTAWFSSPKAEIGNKPTQWTPAPEDAIASVDVEYYLSTSAISLSGGSWSTTAPTWVNGKYMWSRTVTIDGAGNKTYSPSQNGVCIAGAKGETGNTGSAGKGVKSIVEQYYKSTSATSLSGGSWSTTYPGWENGKYIWTRSIITYTDNTSTTTTAVCVTGAKGSTGATGNGISKIEEHYAVSSSNSTAPTSWSSTVPTMTTTNKYLWNYETITYTSGSTVDTTKRVIGVYGNTGSKGDTGANGKSIGSVVNYYLATSASSKVTTGTSGWTTTVQSVSASKKYLWNYEVVKYSDDTTASTTTPCIIGAYGDTGAKGDKGETGATGKGVKSSAVTYQAGTSGTTAPTGAWQSTIPSVSAGSYLWTRTVITYTDNTTSTSYSVGKMGNTGAAGKDAITISATAPTSPKINQLWQTASGESIKRWDGSKWVLHYISVENLDVQKLSAIAADLGTVTAGVIKNKDETVNFDVERGVFESWDTNALQSAKMSAGTFEVSAKDSSDNYVKTYLKYYGLFIHQINKLYGYSIEMDELGEDLLVSKLINNGQGTETVSLFKNLKRTPVAGSKVVTIIKGKNYVPLMTASEAAGLLGIANGTGTAVSLAVSNGDAHAFDARIYGAEYWNVDSSWYVYFNVTASITQSVRVNYILAPII